jgi:hypothetical protein
MSASPDVRYSVAVGVESGHHLLGLSLSAFDPNRSSLDRKN